MKRSKIALLLALLLALAVLNGCSGGPDTSDYPVLEAADISGMNLQEFGDSSITAQFPADTWVDGGSVTGLPTIYLTETYGTDSAVNINMQLSGKYVLPVDETVMESLLQGIGTSGMTVELSELRTLNGETIVYIEAITRFTDELLDELIEQGVFTEELIDSVGGRDYLLARPAVHTVSITAKVDGYLCIYSGTYMDEAHRQEVIDIMTVLVRTTEISE